MTTVRSARIRAFVLRHDPDLLAAKRSAKAAVVVPVVLAVALYGIGNSQTTLFASFGAFAISVLTDFRGTRRRQATAYGGLLVVGAGLTSLGTVCSTSLASAVAGMAVIGFVVLFSAVLGSAPANGTFAALLMFVLPVSIPGGLGEIVPRLAGLALAGAIAVPVSLGVWPRPGASLIRASVHAAAFAVAARLDALASGGDGVGARVDAASALSRLEADLESVPYRPISLAKGDPGVLRIADGLEWLNLNLSLSTESGQPVTGRQVYLDAAQVLRSSAATISDAEGNPAIDNAAASRLTAELVTLVASRHELGLQACASFASPRTEAASVAPVGSTDLGELDAMDPTLGARVLACAAEAIAADALLAGSGETRESPASFGRRILEELAGARHDVVYRRNSLRGAVALALAVLVAKVGNVSHGFWVVLAAMSVLRSNVLGTNSSAVAAIVGTAVGFVIGSAVLIGMGTMAALLWALLPISVFLASIAPRVISFAIGQTGFTMVVVILFNLIAPTGWKVGLVRVEDVALGAGLSVVVGALFWPRGASSVLGRALGEAYAASAAYLSTMLEHLPDVPPGQQVERFSHAASDATRRLDDAARQYSTERGPKPVPTETLQRLLAGASDLRLAASALATLPPVEARTQTVELGAMEAAVSSLHSTGASAQRWYQQAGQVLDGSLSQLGDVPQVDPELESRLRAAVDAARELGDRATATRVVRLVWGTRLLEIQSYLAQRLAPETERFAALARRRWWEIGTPEVVARARESVRHDARDDAGPDAGP